MAIEDSSFPELDATIEQLRYWVPTISDVARVTEVTDSGTWTLALTPRVSSACPVSLTLKNDGRFDIIIGGEVYGDRALGTLDQIVRLLECITEGQVIQRQWVRPSTGTPCGTETIVTLAPGLVWHGVDDGATAEAGSPNATAERHDRHFLPYRRI
jgi:hypothetical protein